mmetsp:Transcript_17842/g.43665  ORF Transcript_17842/g.43665 Transcript_17842/m.43665 type:complete len:248 (-) Transcript_17842:388-1131(-)
MNSNHYQTLGVSPTATNQEVKEAYRRLAKKWHPDSLPDSQKESGEKRFKEICEAYSHLKDAETRRVYDEMPSHQHRPYRGHSAGAGPWTRATSRNSETFKRQHWGNDYDYNNYRRETYDGFDKEFKGYAASEAAAAAPKIPRWMIRLVEGKTPMYIGLAAVTLAAGFGFSTVRRRSKEAQDGYVLAWYNGQRGRWEEPTPAMLNRNNMLHYTLRRVDPKKVFRKSSEAGGEEQVVKAAQMKPWYKNK